MPYLNQDNQTTTGTQGQGRTPLPINTDKAVDRAAEFWGFRHEGTVVCSYLAFCQRENIKLKKH